MYILCIVMYMYVPYHVCCMFHIHCIVMYILYLLRYIKKSCDLYILYILNIHHKILYIHHKIIDLNIHHKILNMHNKILNIYPTRHIHDKIKSIYHTLFSKKSTFYTLQSSPSLTSFILT